MKSKSICTVLLFLLLTAPSLLAQNFKIGIGGGTLDGNSVISSSFRGGLNIGIGTEYTLNDNLGLDISAQYHFMNLIKQNDASEWEKEEDFNLFKVTAQMLFCLKK